MANPDQSLTLNIKPRTIKKYAKWSLTVLVLLGLLAIIPAIKTVVYIIIIALFLAFLLDPVVNFIENRGIERLWAVILVFAFIAFLGGVGFKFLAPVVSKQIKQINSGAKTQSPDELLLQLQQKLGDKLPFLSNPAVQRELKSIIDNLLKESFSVVVGLISVVVTVVMVTFTTFFFLKDGRRMKKAVVSWVPNRYFEMSLNILHKTSTQLGRYIRGQLIVAAIVGTLSIIALDLLNIRFYFFIGAIAGLANMIPYFGPIVGAIPAIIIALVDTGSFGAVVAVAVAFASIQLFENVFVSPFIVSKSVDLHPLTIIIVILIGGQLMGIFGMLLAVPTASIIKVTAQELYWGLKNYRIF
jgi:predicted PurR-regulated permease PerM